MDTLSGPIVCIEDAELSDISVLSWSDSDDSLWDYELYTSGEDEDVKRDVDHDATTDYESDDESPQSQKQ